MRSRRAEALPYSSGNVKEHRLKREEFDNSFQQTAFAIVGKKLLCFVRIYVFLAFY